MFRYSFTDRWMRVLSAQFLCQCFLRYHAHMFKQFKYYGRNQMKAAEQCNTWKDIGLYLSMWHKTYQCSLMVCVHRYIIILVQFHYIYRKLHFKICQTSIYILSEMRSKDVLCPTLLTQVISFKCNKWLYFLNILIHFNSQGFKNTMVKVT